MNKIDKVLVAIAILLIIGLLIMGVALVISRLIPVLEWLLIGVACLLICVILVIIIEVIRQ